MVAMMNTGLACFNLLPAFPMDGGRMLRSALQVFGKTKVRATEIAVKVGRVFAGLWVISAAMGLLLGVQIPCPAVFPSWVEFLWGIVFGDGGVFRLLIAYMIWTAGQRELDYVRAEAEYYGGWR
jgi:Zn-dependent protease